MKVVILAGGLGTRLAEETAIRPKPMVEVGGKPLLYHLLRSYAKHGFKDFIIALGYKGDVIKQYFASFYMFNNDLTIDLSTGHIRYENKGETKDWIVHLVDTGLDTQTGGRLKRIAPLLGAEPFLCTYGDGLASVDIAELVRFHRMAGRMATLTAVRPPARFGALEIQGNCVTQFVEKPLAGEGWISGGFFVFEPTVLDRIAGDSTVLEHEPLSGLARDGQLSVFEHQGFWQPMDSLRDKKVLEDLWSTGQAPWI
jgi:glucose-1-phosphate cytidylyltransferase